jgi:hypothetical protein
MDPDPLLIEEGMVVMGNSVSRDSDAGHGAIVAHKLQTAGDELVVLHV